jgi:hypothetical protein
MSERRWRVIETTRRTFDVVCEDQKLAERCVGIMPASTTHTDKKTVWVDEMDVQHEPECEGTHCGHYGCQEAGDDVPWYCTTCDVSAYQ